MTGSLIFRTFRVPSQGGGGLTKKPWIVINSSIFGQYVECLRPSKVYRHITVHWQNFRLRDNIKIRVQW